ncbi:glycoside hydrolase family 57 protein [Mesotoga sp. UBA5557]|jgi:1,4-alpha-glucan branching enzyme|uniref:glycoside hydrolase family 57 protein n=1 Tax=Mesotoga sp. UBA5557 TaxID=1946857 RepID=UPI000A8F37A7|nr:1,4-alpha-glucan branching protein domain-containing protein [Mesotoga sp. UBA5557]
MSRGRFVLMLHAHLPFINHPDFPSFMEERWLFEAITETYIPLLQAFRRLRSDGVNFKVTMSITPPLMEMLANNDLQKKYLNYLGSSIELAGIEISRTSAEHPAANRLATHYLHELEDIRKVYEECNCNLVGEFSGFQDSGELEIVTCNATHGFLPLMTNFPEAINAQISIGVDSYRRHVGKDPRGIWLAECGYVPGFDSYLREHGLSFFFVDSHSLWYGDPAPRYGVYRPVVTPENVFVLARDPESSQQVWSAEVGYPGDSRYREFYRDVGFDREEDYIRPYIDPSGERCNTGIKYYKITGKDVPLNEKSYYDLDDARRATVEHAKDFANRKREQVRRLSSQFDGEEPVIVAPFDAELFGHWWYEGPLFIEGLFRELNGDDIVVPSTPPEVINSMDQAQVVTPNTSTWGANGYNEVWLNGRNDWIYRHLDEGSRRMIELARKFERTDDALRIRALNQMARELLLAQSSDWAFIITTNTTVEYAVNRTKTHIDRLLRLYGEIESNSIDESRLKTLEWIDSIFPHIDFRVYAKQVG